MVWRKFILVSIISVFVSLIFIVGIPILINESYRTGSGYITMWTAKDVLSYYGSILNSVATITALVVTIIFTTKQYRRDRFLVCARSKWEQVEAIITQALIDISPLKMCDTEKWDNSLSINIHVKISNLQSYSINAKTSLNMIKCYINPDEYKQLSGYIEEIQNAIQQFCSIEEDLEKIYMDLQSLLLENNGVIPKHLLLTCLKKANTISLKISPAHDGTYQRILNMKREVFNQIYANIEKQADQTL